MEIPKKHNYHRGYPRQQYWKEVSSTAIVSGSFNRIPQATDADKTGKHHA
jgi:hypothetical protein